MQCSTGLRHVASILVKGRAARSTIQHQAPALHASTSTRPPRKSDYRPARGTSSSTPPPSIPPEKPRSHARDYDFTPTPKENALKEKSRRLPWVLASLMGGIIAFYSANLYVAATQPCQNPQIAELSQQKDVVARYDETADGFDSDVGFSEWFMGIIKNRKLLAARCRGHVLEVSCGTGRNLGYYDIAPGGKVDSLTFIDISPQMIDVCKKKWAALYASVRTSWFGSTIKPDLSIRFLPASALGEMPLAPTNPPRKYDTIIQTMGLCSTASPAALLENMVRYLDTSNPESKIILLEHGRSYKPWLNRILDNSAEKHAEIHGCWFNRDIGALVEEAAAKTGLEVVNEKRRHFGTTWMFELKPRTGIAKEPSSPSSPSSPELQAVEEKAAKKWFPWSDSQQKG